MNALALDRVAELLGGEASDGQVRAPGPWHSASDRSLSVKLDSKAPEGFLVNSFAEDDPIACRDYVREKLGLPEFKAKKAKSKASGNGEWKFVREHIYKTADGAPHLRKRKYLKPDGGKEFPQAHWSGEKWVDGAPKEWPKVLYRLPELLKASPTSPVYVCEGESDCDALVALGFVATTAGGVSETKPWTKPEFVEPLKGRRVVIVVDSDTPGRKYGEKVARAIDKVADSLRLVDLFPGDVAEKNGRDVSDFLKSDPAGVNFVKAAKDTPLWEPSAGAGDESSAGASDGDDDALITELATMLPMKYERERKKAAERLGVRAPILDRLVAAERSKLGLDVDDGKQGHAISFPEPDSWPDAVDGAALLDAVSAAIAEHVVMEKRFCDVAALWIAHSYLLDYFQVTPRCGIRSPVKRCGKSTLLDVFRCLVYKPLPTSSVTASVTFRVIEKHRPCLLIDEADMLLGSKEDSKDLYSVLNDGHRRGGQTLRNVGDDHEPRAFNTYAAVAIASIGKLFDTLTDRCVIIDLKRRKRDEPIKPFRLDRADHLTKLARQLMRWTIDHAERVAVIDPDMPSNVYNRDADNWRPLLAIADIAGGDWPKKARGAAMAACGAGDDDEGSYLERLLGDIYDVFAKREENKVEPADEIPSAALVETLVAIESRPWAEMGRNAKPLTQNKLARMLKPLGIGPEPIGPKTDRVRGYVLKAFTEAFDRYLPGKGASRVSTRPQCDEQGTSELFQSVHPETGGRFEKSEKSNNDGLMDGWTVVEGETSEEIEFRPSGECAAKSSRAAGSGTAEPGLPQAVIRKHAAWYSDAAADQMHATGNVDRTALDAELRRRLAEDEGVYPEFIEVELQRVLTEVFRA